MRVYVDDRELRLGNRMLRDPQRRFRLVFTQPDAARRGCLQQEAPARHQAAAFCPSRSATKSRLDSTSSQEPAQKHMSMHHQLMFGTASNCGASDLKSMKPSPNGRCVLVSSPCSVPSESIRWMAPMRPSSFLRNSGTPPGSVSRAPCCRAPTTPHM